MRIGGLHKTSLIDFPGRVAAVVFTQGCNFHCPYCHNPELIQDAGALVSEAELLDFLRLRRTVLQGLVITGGEPCLHQDLPDFCREVKALGYEIKLDSNGSRPDMLEALLAEGLLDYVAMDLKSDPAVYSQALCPAPLKNSLLRSMDILAASGVEYEYRLTCVFPFLDEAIFARILERVPDKVPLFLQKARLEAVLAPDFFKEEGRALTDAEIASLLRQALASGKVCNVR